MSEPGPVARVLEEGGSAGIASWVRRIDAAVPSAGPAVGFWVAVYARFARHRGSVLAGGLAFFGLLSLVPSLLSLGAVIALVYNPADFAEDVEILVADHPQAAQQVAPILDAVAQLEDVSVTSFGLAGMISLAVSLYAASRFVYVGRQVLDIAFEQDPQPPSLLSRAIAIAITLVAQVAVVLAVILMTLVPRILEGLGVGELYSDNVRWVRIPLVLLVVYLLLTAALRYGIRARTSVPWLNLGAALGTLVILLGTLGLSWYLGVSVTYSQIVAFLGGVVAFEIWLYVVGLAIVGSAEIEGMRRGFRRRDLPRGQSAAPPGAV